MLAAVACVVLAAQAGAPSTPQQAEYLAEEQVKSQPTAENWQRLGLARYLQNRFEPAIAAFREATSRNPALWPSHLFLGISLYRTNAFADALAALEHARRLAPAKAQGSDDIDYWLGATLFALGRRWDGLRRLEDLIARTPAHKDALAMLARGYADLAGSLWNGVAERHFDTAPGLEIHGHALESEGNVVDALDAYRRSSAKDPTRAGPRVAAARLLLQQGKPADALREIEAVRAPGPSQAEVSFLTALAYLQMGRTQDALAPLERASEWDHHDPEIAVALAQVLLARGEHLRAAQAARHALELDPQSAAARELLAAAESGAKASSPR